MKKFILLFSFAAISLGTQAQVYLSGAGPYVENFDGIASGLPAGFSVMAASSSTSIGTLATYHSSTTYPPSYLNSDSTCIAAVLTGGFKNFPSATVAHVGDDYCSSSFPIATNRALGVRQVSTNNASNPYLDSGAAFVFKLANTRGMTGVNLAFKLQSLDTASSRQTTWQVDYALGGSTTFTPATTTGFMTTGGHRFFDTAVTASFGSALDNQYQAVTIRIVTLLYSSSAIAGSGNRASTAIDNFTISWTGTAKTAVEDVATAPAIDLTALGTATPDKMTFEYSAENAGNYNFAIYDLSGRQVHSQVIDAVRGNEQFSVTGLNLATGMYIAKMTNGNSSTVAKVIVQ